MIFAGDEFCNTQFGNNNPYCQDNEISWVDWSLLEKNRDMFEFFKNMIEFRKIHPILKNSLAPAKCGLPDMSKHGNEPWYIDSSREAWVLGIMFAGFNEETDEDDIVYIGINIHWEKQCVRLPDLPVNFEWRMAVNTGMSTNRDFIESVEEMEPILDRMQMEPRSVVIALGIKVSNKDLRLN